MKRTKILVCDAGIAANLDALRPAVSDDVEWRIYPDAAESELVQEMTDTTIYIGGTFTATMAQAAPELQLLQVPATGLDDIAVDALPDHVILANTYNHERSIAEYVMMVMLVLTRQLRQADANLRRGIWQVQPAGDISFRSLQGRVLGLVGFGHIGKQVAQLARAFEMRVRAIQRKPDPSLAQEYGLEFLGGMDDLASLLRDSDFIVLVAPLTPTTRHMLGVPQLALLKPSAFLINVSRADIVAEHALYTALAEHKIAGAALDVWYRYPTDASPTLPANLPFHLLDNVILTPHYSGATEQTRAGRFADVMLNLQNFLNGKPLRNVIAHHS